MSTFIWHNGEFKAANTPVFTFNDRIALGDGVFDTMLAIDARPRHADLHFTRLVQHADLLGITIPYDREKLIDIATLLIERNNIRSGRHAIKTIITRGITNRGLTPDETFPPNVVMSLTSLAETITPIHAIIAKHVQRNEKSPLSRIKSCNYGDNILAKIEAENADVHEAIMLNTLQNIACATIGNIFAMINTNLYTPPLSDGAINGVTRTLLLQNHGAREQSLKIDDLYNAQGIYISNSLRGLVPISFLDGVRLPQIEIKNLEL